MRRPAMPSQIMTNSKYDHQTTLRATTGTESIGALLVKPDAVEGGQLEFIRQIVKNKIAPYNGRIALELCMADLSPTEVEVMYPSLPDSVLSEVQEYLGNGTSVGMVVRAPLPLDRLTRVVSDTKGPRLWERTAVRLEEGRITNGTIRDLLPLPGDEAMYHSLKAPLALRSNNLDKVHADPAFGFTAEQRIYYGRNLAHTPDNEDELHGLLRVIAQRAILQEVSGWVRD